MFILSVKLKKVMSAQNLLLRQGSDESFSNILPSSPSLTSLNRLRDTFRRTESISSRISSMVSNAAATASGVVTGTSTGAPTDEASSASSQTGSPKKKKPGKSL